MAKKFCDKENCCKGKKCGVVAAIIIAIVLAFCFIGCEKYDDSALREDIAALEAEVLDLQSELDKATASRVQMANEIIALQNVAGQLPSILDAAALSVLAEIQPQIDSLQVEIDAIEIPSVEGLSSTSDIAALQAQLAALQAELNDLEDQLGDSVVYTAWSPVFATQIATFTQTQTSTIADEVLNTYEREINVYANGPVSNTVTSTVISVGRSNVEGITDADLNDAVVEQTTTTTTYTFHIEDADEAAYEHAVSSTTSWTIKN